MEEKGALTKWSLTCLPFVLVGALGAYNQLVVESVPAPEYGYALSKRVDAYIEPVGSVQRRLLLKDRTPTDAAVFEVAQLWIGGLRSGDLRHISTVHATDSAREGVKEQILAARATLTSNLVRVAAERELGGDLETALAALVAAYELQRIGARFDVGALTSSYAGQNASLRRINSLIIRTGVRLTPAQERAIRPMERDWLRETFAEQSRAFLGRPLLGDRETDRMASQFQSTLASIEAGNFRHDRHAAENLQGHAPKLMYANLGRVNQLRSEQQELLRSLREERQGMVADSDQYRTSSSRS